MSAPDLYRLRARHAADRVERGLLSEDQRQRLADLLLVLTTTAGVPTSAMAATEIAVDALAQPVDVEVGR